MNPIRSSSSTRRWMIYGASGYTGELVAREAREQGLEPILTGRNPSRVGALADDLSLPYRIFDLQKRSNIIRNIGDVDLVLHCAGPFVHTARSMYESCLQTSVHYLDISGEIPVLESIYALDTAARDRGVVLMSGVGFDVVPTDCLALGLKKRFPTATRLRMFIDAGSEQSRGTFKSTIETIIRDGTRRRNGILESERLGSSIRRYRLGDSKRWLLRIPWGDLSSAYHSTVIPIIEDNQDSAHLY